MVEGLSLAGMIETPVVIRLAQRPAQVAGLRVGRAIGKYDGRPLTPAWIVREVSP
jgi:hypothetical protein